MATNRYELPVRYESAGVPIIRMHGINKIFKTAAGEAPVLKDVDVAIGQGQFVSIVGRSGSGKSTLVNMITGIDRPTSGTVEVAERPIHQMPESKMAVWRGKNLGIVFQFFQLLPMLTLVENVMLPMDFCNIYAPASRETRAMDLLHRVGLEAFAHKLPGAVSGGQQQSAAVARALANDPPILIADEPTGNLDSATAAQVMAIFEELIDQGKTILLVTHDRSLARRAHRTLLISDGELVHESLAAAFPDAPHADLLHLTKQSRPVQLPPDAPLLDAPSPTAPYYLLVQGEIVCGAGDETEVRRRGALVDPRANRCPLRAGEHGADLLVLPREEILELLSPEDQPAPVRSSPVEEARTVLGGWFRRRRTR